MDLQLLWIIYGPSNILTSGIIKRIQTTGTFWNPGNSTFADYCKFSKKSAEAHSPLNCVFRLRTRTVPELSNSHLLDAQILSWDSKFVGELTSEAKSMKRRTKMLCPNWRILEWGGHLHPIKNEKIYIHPWTCVFLSKINGGFHP